LHETVIEKESYSINYEKMARTRLPAKKAAKSAFLMLEDIIKKLRLQ
jgi:hypothetical protein